MNPIVKSLVMRFVRVAVAGLLVAVVAFLSMHGKEVFSGVGVPVNILDFVWPLATAALAALDKYARDLKAKNE